jgi:hypothetical protein
VIPSGMANDVRRVLASILQNYLASTWKLSIVPYAWLHKGLTLTRMVYTTSGIVSPAADLQVDCIVVYSPSKKSVTS